MTSIILSSGLRTTQPPDFTPISQRNQLSLMTHAYQHAWLFCWYLRSFLFPREYFMRLSMVSSPRLALFPSCSLRYLSDLRLHTPIWMAVVILLFQNTCRDSCIFLGQLARRHGISVGQTRWIRLGRRQKKNRRRKDHTGEGQRGEAGGCCCRIQVFRV